MALASTASLHGDDFFRILETRALPELQSYTDQLVRRLGFEAFFVVTQLPTHMDDLIHFGSYPQGWIERYQQQDFSRVDPAAQHCLQHHYPLAWTNGLFMSRPDVASFYEEARAFGISAGGICPLPSSHLRFGGMGFSRNQDADAALEDVQRVLPLMHMLSAYVYETLRKILPTTPLQGNAASIDLPYLTTRERECLLYAASGLSNVQIADRLRMSSRTVHFHFSNVRSKLGTRGRAQMVAKAILLGLLSV